MGSRVIDLLLIEDNPGDVRLIREMLKGGGSIFSLDTVKDGLEALQYLQQEGRFSRSTRPDIVLLDWFLPRKSGEDVLAEMSKNEKLKDISTIILTGSEPDMEILGRFKTILGVLKKPPKLHEFYQMLEKNEKIKALLETAWSRDQINPVTPASQ